jgi:ferredoxin
MADIANKYPDNVAGKYYVDNQCIDCDLCRETAPNNFQRNEDGGYSFVFKQPENDEEEAQCKEAKEGCPVEAIGDNGDLALGPKHFAVSACSLVGCRALGIGRGC